MKKILFALQVMAMLTLTAILPGCSKDNTADAEALLSTVPSTASMAGVANLQAMLEKSGCKINGAEIKPGKEMQAAIEGITDPGQKAMAESILNGKSGIRPTVCVIFNSGADTFITGLLEDTEAFKTFITERTKEKFAEISGVNICGKFAIVGDQFWVAGRRSGSSLAETVEEFTKLSRQQSYLSGDHADKFTALDDDFRMVIDITGFANNIPNLDFRERAMMATTLNTLFKDAAYSLITLNFNKEKVVFDAKILNPKGKTAAFNLPLSKIDTDVVKRLGGEADVACAIAVSPKLVRKIEDVMKSFGGVVPSLYANILSPLDGTCVVAAAKGDTSHPRAIITTDGSASNDLTSILSGAGSVDRDGKYIYFEKGVNTGKGLTLDDASGYMKGAFLAVVSADPAKYPGIKVATFGLWPDGDGIELKGEAVAEGDESNILKSFIKMASAIR